jgi:hypothetical protein
MDCRIHALDLFAALYLARIPSGVADQNSP